MDVFTVLSIHRLTGKSYTIGTYQTSNKEEAEHLAYCYISDELTPDKRQWIDVVILQTTFKDYEIPVTTIVQ